MRFTNKIWYPKVTTPPPPQSNVIQRLLNPKVTSVVTSVILRHSHVKPVVKGVWCFQRILKHTSSFILRLKDSCLWEDFYSFFFLESENNYTRSTLEDALNDIEIPEFEVHTPDELAQNVSFGTASRKKKMLRRSVYVVLQDEEGSREQTIGTTCIVRVKKKETSKCKYFYLTHDEVVRDQSNLCMERSCSRLLKRKHKETLTKDQELKTCFLRNNLSLCLIPVYEVTEQPRSFLDLDVDYAKTVDSNKANPAKFRTYTVRAKDFVKIYLKRNDQNTWQPREYKFKPNKHSEAEHARVCGAPVVVKDEQRDLKVVGIMGSDYIPILISAPAPHRMARGTCL